MITKGSGQFSSTVTDAEGNEHEVEVFYKGYSDPGVCSGPVERCYSPEGEVDIHVVGVAAGIEIPEREHERLQDEAFKHITEGNYD